jgi:hypothetical protein
MGGARTNRTIETYSLKSARQFYLGHLVIGVSQCSVGSLEGGVTASKGEEAESLP